MTLFTQKLSNHPILRNKNHKYMRIHNGEEKIHCLHVFRHPSTPFDDKNVKPFTIHFECLSAI